MELGHIPTEYRKWLNDRGISDEVLIKNNISVHKEQIVIPVFDENRNFLFNKYRRNPWSEEGPKYRYDAGSTSALYNIHTVNFKNSAVFICEGELDAMALQSQGYQAVSTTGGAGTFKEEWAGLLGVGRIYIAYDNDLAGIQGTFRLLSLIPTARVILIPSRGGVKDVTDFLKANEPKEFGRLMREAQEWIMPKTKIECRERAVTFEERRQEALSHGTDSDFAGAALGAVAAIYDSFQTKEKKKKYQNISDARSAISAARAVPIGEYVTFNKKGDALCVAHDDKHPSMHWFRKNNKVKCFACGFSGDTIDVVMRLENITVGEAISKINS